MHHLAPLVACLALVGCGMVTLKPTPNPTTAPAAPSYAPWVLNGCTISARGADLLLTTQGHLTSSGMLELKVLFAPLLTRPPFAHVSTLPVAVGIEGQKRLYNLMLPYNPESAAALLQPATQLTLTYQPLGQTAFQELSFPTASLLAALGAMGPVCPE